MDGNRRSRITYSNLSPIHSGRVVLRLALAAFVLRPTRNDSDPLKFGVSDFAGCGAQHRARVKALCSSPAVRFCAALTRAYAEL